MTNTETRSGITWAWTQRDTELLAGLCSLFLFAGVITSTWTKIYFDAFGKLNVANAFFVVYLVGYLVLRVGPWRRRSVSDATAVAAIFFMVLTAIFSLGFTTIDSTNGQSQFWKAFVTWLVHGSAMVAVADHIAVAGKAFFRRIVMVFILGGLVNAGYGVAQIAFWFPTGGGNLDSTLLGPIPLLGDGSEAGILRYGGGIWRINGLTLDPNHLGVILAAPLVLAMTWLRGRTRMFAVCIIGGALILSLSRSGMVAAASGVLLIGWNIRHSLLRPRFILGATGLLALTVVSLLSMNAFFPNLTRSLIIARFDTGTGSAQTHLGIFGLIPVMLAESPLTGVGLNSFSLMFEKISGGREGFGPHSVVVRMLVETGVLGFAAWSAMILWILGSLHRFRIIVGLAGAGVAAAIAGSIAGNVFYLTTQIVYFDLLLAFGFAFVALAQQKRAMIDHAYAYDNTLMQYNPKAMATSTRTNSSQTAESPVVFDQMGGSPKHSAEASFFVPALRKFWWIVFALALAGAIAAWFGTSSRKQMYSATATVYLGQPVSPNGTLLNTVSASASTAMEVAKGDEVMVEAGKELGVAPQRIRKNTTVTAVQAPIASKLGTPPSLLKIKVTDTRPKVASGAAGIIASHLTEKSNEYATRKLTELDVEVSARKASIRDIEKQQRIAAKAASKAKGDSTAMWAVILAGISRDLAVARADLSATKGRAEVAREIEKSAVVVEPSAIKETRASRTPIIAMAGIAGMIFGMVLVWFLGRLRVD